MGRCVPCDDDADRADAGRDERYDALESDRTRSVIVRVRGQVGYGSFVLSVRVELHPRPSSFARQAGSAQDWRFPCMKG